MIYFYFYNKKDEKVQEDVQKDVQKNKFECS